LSETTTDKRNIGETSARQIEQACNLPELWLDVGGLLYEEDTLVKARQKTLAVTYPKDEVVFNQLDAYAACGEGYANNDYPEIIRTLVMTPAEALQLVGSTNRSGAIQVILAVGDSMTPTIEPRDLLFVDTDVKEYNREGIYFLRIGDELICKRMHRAGQKLMVSSDNKRTDPWEWSNKGDKDAIVGQVIRVLPMTFKQF
jgi:phage repressor protein C with HTH and peptisase S24 domain